MFMQRQKNYHQLINSWSIHIIYHMLLKKFGMKRMSTHARKSTVGSNCKNAKIYMNDYGNIKQIYYTTTTIQRFLNIFRYTKYV